MDRRSFFRAMIGGVAASAAVRTWPFRVYSFPSNIVIPAKPIAALSAQQLKILEAIRQGKALREFMANPLRFNRLFSGGELQLEVTRP